MPTDPTRIMLDCMDLGSNMLYRYRALLAAAPKAKPASNRQKNLQRDLDKLEQHIQRLQKNKGEQEAALSGTTDASAIAETGRKLQAIHEELDALEIRWLALAEDIEACKA